MRQMTYENLADYAQRLETLTRPELVDEMHRCLCKLWGGGGGDYGVYTVAHESDRLKAVMHLLFDDPPIYQVTTMFGAQP